MSFQNLNLARKMIRNLFEETLKKDLDGHTSLDQKPELKGLKWWIDTPKTEFSERKSKFDVTISFINESLDKVRPLDGIDDITTTIDEKIEEVWKTNKHLFNLKKTHLENKIDGRHGLAHINYEVEVWN